MNHGTVYKQYGDKRNPCVVLIHGLGLNRDVWGTQLSDLSKSYHVITYDLLWHGEATSPELTPSLTVFSQQLQALLDHCNVDRAAIVGFSPVSYTHLTLPTIYSV